MSRELLSQLNWEDREFFVEPPSNNASIEEWEAWLVEDKKARTVSKTKHTKLINSLADEMGITADDFVNEIPTEITRKVNGKYSQGVLVGFTGDSEQGTCQAEAVVDAQQTKIAILHSWADQNAKRGTKSKGRSARKRAAKRAKKAKKHKQ